MKKLFSLLLALLLLSAVCPAVRAEDGAVEIRDRAALEAIAQNPAGHYVLVSDIDLADGDWTPIPFSGTLDGAGHTILNLHVTGTQGSRTTCDGNDKPYTSSFAGLFSELTGAQISDLNLLGAFVEIENSDNAFAGLLAGYIEDSTVRNCSVSGRVHMATYAIDAGIGGIAGYGCGSFLGCSAEVELVHEDRTAEHRCEEFVGGILGCGIAHIEGCTVAIEGYVSCNGFAHNGGLTGMYYVCGFPFEDRVVSVQFEIHESASPFDELHDGKPLFGNRLFRLDADVPAAFLDRTILFPVVVGRAVAVDVPGDINGLRHLDVEVLVAGDTLLQDGENCTDRVRCIEIAPLRKPLRFQDDILLLDGAAHELSKNPSIVIFHARAKGLRRTQNHRGDAILAIISITQGFTGKF